MTSLVTTQIYRVKYFMRFYELLDEETGQQTARRANEKRSDGWRRYQDSLAAATDRRSAAAASPDPKQRARKRETADRETAKARLTYQRTLSRAASLDQRK